MEVGRYSLKETVRFAWGPGVMDLFITNLRKAGFKE